MRHLRLALLSLLALAVAVPGVLAQTSLPLSGGGQTTVKVLAAKGKKPKKAKKGKKHGKAPAKGRTNTVRIGIADEKSQMFTDLRFRALGTTTARRSVAWDTFLPGNEWQVPEIDEWMHAARAAGVSPMISFNRSRVDRHTIPTRQQWLAGFAEFRRRYPWVTDFAATNESNHTPPTHSRPRLAAKYYRDMRKACPTCRIAAATINERPEKKYVEGWIRRFRKALGKHRPKYWALHNYYGANTFSLKGTKRFLKATKSGEVWVTEVGGLVKRRSTFTGKLKMREGLAHSTKSWRFIFKRMLGVSPRIKRAYLYHWNSATATDSWDSALIGADDQPRRALAVVQRLLAK
jgi:hypothetical protein